MTDERMPYQKGDFVCRKTDMLDEEINDDHMAHVTGFGPGKRWLKVKTLSGKYKTWLDEHVHNVDYMCGEGNYS